MFIFLFLSLPHYFSVLGRAVSIPSATTEFILSLGRSRKAFITLSTHGYNGWSHTFFREFVAGSSRKQPGIYRGRGKEKGGEERGGDKEKSGGREEWRKRGEGEKKKEGWEKKEKGEKEREGKEHGEGAGESSTLERNTGERGEKRGRERESNEPLHCTEDKH